MGGERMTTDLSRRTLLQFLGFGALSATIPFATRLIPTGAENAVTFTVNGLERGDTVGLFEVDKITGEILKVLHVGKATENKVVTCIPEFEEKTIMVRVRNAEILPFEITTSIDKSGGSVAATRVKDELFQAP